MHDCACDWQVMGLEHKVRNCVPMRWTTIWDNCEYDQRKNRYSELAI